jgi:hypothetical protein
LGVSNLEARIKRLENTSSNEFGNPTNSILYPVRKLMLTEEVSHDEDGVAFSVLVATWDKPAGLIFPETIRLIHNGTTVSLAGTATSYRMPGYLIGDTVTVNVTAMYLQGASSTVTAVKTITGDATPPSVPTNLTVTGGFRTLTLRWENPTTEDFSHVEIWESVIGPDVATSERIAQAYGTEFVRSNCAVLETRWYWIRAIDTHGNYSDFTSVASGTTTAIAMEDVPENTISESMLISELASEINKIPAIEEDVNLINQELDAEAGQRLLLAAKVDNNLSAIQTEATARANADSAMASQITTLQATTGDNTAAIQIVEDVRMGEVNVFRQASAPTTGMITGDLWIDNTEVVHRYEGGEWVSKEGTPVYDLLKTAIAQYVVKTQTATGDGKLKVAGFGLYNDSTTGSEFAVLADKFYVYAQKEDGSSYTNVQVFTVDATTTPPTVGINGNLIVDGSIVGEKIFSGAKIQLGDGGEFITGANSIVQMASGVITLDSEGGIIQVRDPANVSTGDFVRIDTGDITTYKYIGGAYYPMKSLRRMDTGTGVANNTTVTLKGRFPSQPEIFVSPCVLQSFHPSYSSQAQTLSLQATNVAYNASTGVCTFKPVAQLIVAAGSGSSGATPANSGTTGTATYRGSPYYDFTFPVTDVSLTSISLPANVGTINVAAKVYAQAERIATYIYAGGDSGDRYRHYVIPHLINYTIYANIAGTNYVIGSGQIGRPAGLISLATEPTAYYINKNTNITLNNASPVSMVVWARFTPAAQSDASPPYYEVAAWSSGLVSNPSSGISLTNYNRAWLAYTAGSYTLPATTVLASGTLNYIAISE